MDAYSEVTKMIAAHLGCDASDFTMDTDLERLGIDSLEKIELEMELEEKLGVILCPEEPPRTIGDLVALVPCNQAN